MPDFAGAIAGTQSVDIVRSPLVRLQDGSCYANVPSFPGTAGSKSIVRPLPSLQHSALPLAAARRLSISVRRPGLGQRSVRAGSARDQLDDGAAAARGSVGLAAAQRGPGCAAGVGRALWRQG